MAGRFDFSADPLDLPLRVVPDWAEQVMAGDRLAQVIDEHLERAQRRGGLTPIGLRAERRARLVAGLLAVWRGRR